MHHKITSQKVDAWTLKVIEDGGDRYIPHEVQLSPMADEAVISLLTSAGESERQMPDALLRNFLEIPKDHKIHDVSLSVNYQDKQEFWVKFMHQQSVELFSHIKAMRP